MATEKFHYTTEAGKKISLPKFKNIPVGVIRKVRKESQVEQMFTILEAVTDEATIAKVDALGSEELGQLIQAWQEDSKVNMGESEASSTS